jgi:hypothetical protein
LKTKEYITIHQAYYGEVGRSHSWIATSIEDQELHGFLTRFTDRPGAVPSGHSLAPYYSGIQYGAYYIFTLTTADPSADRGGMVFSHAFIIDLGDIEDLHNLEALFDLFLHSRVPVAGNLSPLNLPASMFVRASNPPIFPEYIRKAVGILTEDGPSLLFCGSLSSLGKLVIALWAGLPMSLRKKTSFTAAFSADNLDSRKTVLYFQPSLANLLQNQTHVSGEESSEVELTGEVEKFILTGAENNRFELFLISLNIEVKDWSLLNKSIKAYKAYQLFLEEMISSEQLKLLIRTIANISPDPANGKAVKTKLIENLKSKIVGGKDRNIKSLRNFPVGLIAQGINLLSSAIGISIEDASEDAVLFNTQDFANLIILLKDSQEQGWWENAVEAGIQLVIRDPNRTKVFNIWKLLQSNDKVAEYLFGLMAKSANFEEVLIAEMPAVLLPDTAKGLAKLCKGNRWYYLHALLLPLYLPVKDAIQEQFSIEGPKITSASPGLEFLLGKTSDQDLLVLALDNKHQILTSEYAARSAKHPMLLAKLDTGQLVWLQIWGASLEITQDLRRGILNPESVIKAYLDQVIISRTSGKTIFELMDKEGMNDLTGYQNRRDIWKHITPELSKSFLATTASAIAEQIADGKVKPSSLEKELFDEVKTDTTLTRFLERYKEDAGMVFSLYEKLPALKDDFLADYVRFYRPQLTDIDSSRLGRLVDQGNLWITARQIFDKAKQRDDFRAALSECRRVLKLNFFERLRFSEILYQKVSYDDLYDALRDIALQLYYQGPEQDEVWKRAGGDVSKLYQHKTREENWFHAISLLRSGKAGHGISEKSLLETMLEDSPHNSELKELYSYFKN